MRAAVRRLATFVGVGSAAAAVHLGTVKMLVEALGWPPIASNVVGWGVAFVVSYLGHRSLTFSDQQAPRGQTLRRFFLVSATAFAVNELTYAALLAWTPLRYDVALFLVLVGVAVFTYLSSRHWAFLDSSASRP